MLKIFGFFSEKLLKIKGNFGFGTQNLQNFRLRRTKMKEINQPLYQKSTNIAKIAPEGRENLSERKCVSFLKKTLILPLEFVVLKSQTHNCRPPEAPKDCFALGNHYFFACGALVFSRFFFKGLSAKWHFRFAFRENQSFSRNQRTEDADFFSKCEQPYS